MAIKELVNKHKYLHKQLHELPLEMQNRIAGHDVFPEAILLQFAKLNPI